MSLSYSPGSLLYFEHTLIDPRSWATPKFYHTVWVPGRGGKEANYVNILSCNFLISTLPPPPPPPTSIHTHTHTHTNTVPSKLPAIGGRSAGHPDGEEGDEVPSDVRQHVGCVCHDGQTASQITPCEKKFLYNGRREREGRWIDGLIEGLKTRVV